MERLYYTDSLLTQFDAAIVEVGEVNGRPFAVLDRTAFYPTSGGQPHDLGQLGEARVVEVIERGSDGVIQHVLDRALSRGARVPAEVDWRRRRDHMQQHSGQHVLSASFERRFGIATVSFHLGGDVSTIDLATSVNADIIGEAELLANEVVWDDRPVTVRFVSAEEARSLPLRKEPVRGGTLRVIEVEQFDLSACGGTHVPRTGAIGAIVISGWERHKGGARVSFVCGGRALRETQRWRDVVASCARQLSSLPGELPQAIDRLQEEQKTLRQQARRSAEEALHHEAETLAAGAVEHDGRSVVRAVVDRPDPRELKALAQSVVERAGHLAILVSRQRPALLAVARADDVAIDAGRVVRHLAEQLGGRGGGRPELAQAGGLDAEPQAILDLAAAALDG
jgi:alanyl-tRNA synthetase